MRSLSSFLKVRDLFRKGRIQIHDQKKIYDDLNDYNYDKCTTAPYNTQITQLTIVPEAIYLAETPVP